MRRKSGDRWTPARHDPRGNEWAPAAVSGGIRHRGRPRARGPKMVPHLDRALVRKTPSLAIGGSAHSQTITSRAGNTSYSVVVWSRASRRLRRDSRLCTGGFASEVPRARGSGGHERAGRKSIVGQWITRPGRARGEPLSRPQPLVRRGLFPLRRRGLGEPSRSRARRRSDRRSSGRSRSGSAAGPRGRRSREP